MAKHQSHFKTPMGWLICNSAGPVSPITTNIKDVTCKFCIQRFSKPVYRRQLEAWKGKRKILEDFQVKNAKLR